MSVGQFTSSHTPKNHANTASKRMVLLQSSARARALRASLPGSPLWGGATLEEWRGRGIYRALVARRAQVAAENGRRYLETDASDDSRPILERLGFVAVTTTTPYVWSPPA